jgi:hypothetical protein
MSIKVMKEKGLVPEILDMKLSTLGSTEEDDPKGRLTAASFSRARAGPMTMTEHRAGFGLAGDPVSFSISGRGASTFRTIVVGSETISSSIAS